METPKSFQKDSFSLRFTLILFLFIFLSLEKVDASLRKHTQVSLKELEAPRATCDYSASSCEIKLQIDNTAHVFTVKRTEGLFAPGCTIASHTYGDLSSLLGVSEQRHQRYLSTALEGMATVSIFDSQVRHGLFFIKDLGWIEYSGFGKFSLVDYDRKDKARHLQGLNSYFRNWRGASAIDPIRFVNPTQPGTCFPGDYSMNLAVISIVIDYSYYQSVIGTKSLAMKDAIPLLLQSLDDVVALAQLIWSAQLNIKLTISHVEIGESGSPSPLNASKSPKSTCLDASAAFYTLRDRWVPQRNSKTQWGGTTVMISSCFTSELGGAADVGTFCRSPSGLAVTGPSAKDFAHELGHTFGAGHSFEDGVGTTGGIMDYGSGFFQGVQQFHPKKREEICSFLTRTRKNGCAQFVEVINGTSPSEGIMCGDGILAPDEQCECLDQSLSCGKCTRCRLTSPAECSTRFAIRRANDRGYIKVGNEMVSSAECCPEDTSIAAVSKTCNGGKDMCGLGGFCLSICRSLGLTPCGTDWAGCRQKCMVNGLCVETSSKMTARDVTLNAVVDGTICRSLDPLKSAKGLCQNGLCTFNDGAEQSLPPTNQPTPVRITSSPTKMTKSPSGSPTTPKPVIAGCSTRKKKNLCIAPCMWCNNKLGCRGSCGAASKKKKKKKAIKRKG